MSNLIFFNMMTLDGFFAGVDGNIDWHNTDEEFNEFAIKQTGTFGTLIFGKTTYELMASYWPTEQGVKDDSEVAKIMNSLKKIVYSKTLEKVDWENTEVKKEVDPEEIKNLKESSGKDIAIFGSADLASTFIKHDLIDEYRILINPLILGKGKPLFKDVEKKKLQLIDSRVFKNGNVLLTYVPVN